MTQERPDAVTLKGNPLTLLGPQLRVGDRAPDFKAVDNKLQTVTLSETSGSVRVFSVVPSLDTPVCDVMTRRFNQEAAQLSDVRIYTISMDLPFAQSPLVCGLRVGLPDHAFRSSRRLLRRPLWDLGQRTAPQFQGYLCD